MRRWTTDPQLRFLMSYLEKFRRHQKDGTVADFWPNVYLHWFETYPEEFYDGDKPMRKVCFYFYSR